MSEYRHQEKITAPERPVIFFDSFPFGIVLLTESRTGGKIVSSVNKSAKGQVKQHEFVDGKGFFIVNKNGCIVNRMRGPRRQAAAVPLFLWQNACLTGFVTEYTAAVNGSCSVIVCRDKAPALSARQDVSRYEEQSGDEHRFSKGAASPKGQTVFVSLFRAGRSGDLPLHNLSSFSW